MVSTKQIGIESTVVDGEAIYQVVGKREDQVKMFDEGMENNESG